MNEAVASFYWSNLESAEHVLDIGCATGDLAKFKPDDAFVLGLDNDLLLLSQARDYCNVAIAWDLDRTAYLPFCDGYFDGVVAKDVLEHLHKPWRTVSEITRVLRPGGTVLASVICERGYRTWNDYTHVRGFTMQSIRKMFIDGGLEVLDVWRMGAIPLTSRLNLIRLIPDFLRFPPFDWIWTSTPYKSKHKLHWNQ